LVAMREERFPLLDVSIEGWVTVTQPPAVGRFGVSGGCW
jgi:hypothetical protein